MSLRNQNWINFNGDPVTGRAPTRVRVTPDKPGLVMTAAQEGFVAHAYKLFCDAVKFSAFPDGYHVQNRVAPDGTEVRMESNFGVHRVFVKIRGVDNPEVEVDIGGIGIMFANLDDSLIVGDKYTIPEGPDGLPGARPFLLSPKKKKEESLPLGWSIKHPPKLLGGTRLWRNPNGKHWFTAFNTGRNRMPEGWVTTFEPDGDLPNRWYAYEEVWPDNPFTTANSATEGRYIADSTLVFKGNETYCTLPDYTTTNELALPLFITQMPDGSKLRRTLVAASNGVYVYTTTAQKTDGLENGGLPTEYEDPVFIPTSGGTLWRGSLTVNHSGTEAVAKIYSHSSTPNERIARFNLVDMTVAEESAQPVNSATFQRTTNCTYTDTITKTPHLIPGKTKGPTSCDGSGSFTYDATGVWTDGFGTELASPYFDEHREASWTETQTIAVTTEYNVVDRSFYDREDNLVNVRERQRRSVSVSASGSFVHDTVHPDDGTVTSLNVNYSESGSGVYSYAETASAQELDFGAWSLPLQSMNLTGSFSRSFANTELDTNSDLSDTVQYGSDTAALDVTLDAASWSRSVTRRKILHVDFEFGVVVVVEATVTRQFSVTGFVVPGTPVSFPAEAFSHSGAVKLKAYQAGTVVWEEDITAHFSQPGSNTAWVNPPSWYRQTMFLESTNPEDVTLTPQTQDYTFFDYTPCPLGSVSAGTYAPSTRTASWDDETTSYTFNESPTYEAGVSIASETWSSGGFGLLSESTYNTIFLGRHAKHPTTGVAIVNLVLNLDVAVTTDDAWFTHPERSWLLVVGNNGVKPLQEYEEFSDLPPNARCWYAKGAHSLVTI